jgi:glutathione synthase/RimK-type ligase-like ATP-grasp enzyme
MIGIFSVKSKTSKSLAEMLDFSLFYPNSSYKPPVSTIIRWGVTTSGPQGNYLNSAQAVRNATNKETARRIFMNNDLPTPQLLSVPPETFPCVARPDHHKGGRKFFYCHDIYDVRRAIRKGAQYFSPYYPKTKEYRVHIGSGKLIAISIKENGDLHAKNWNHKKGFKFRYLYQHEWDIEVIRLAKKAIKALELDFGAVDIMSEPTDISLPHAVICEVNTAPALSPYGLSKYVEYFKRAISENLSQSEDQRQQEH